MRNVVSCPSTVYMVYMVSTVYMAEQVNLLKKIYSNIPTNETTDQHSDIVGSRDWLRSHYELKMKRLPLCWLKTPRTRQCSGWENAIFGNISLLVCKSALQMNLAVCHALASFSFKFQAVRLPLLQLLFVILAISSTPSSQPCGRLVRGSVACLAFIHSFIHSFHFIHYIA